MIAGKSVLIKGGGMKKVFISLMFLSMFGYAFAGQTIERYNFYNQYNPTSTRVYIADNSSATGNQVAVNTYTQKSIQINPISVNEYIEIRIEGRSLNQINSPVWAILDEVEFGAASADIYKQKCIDVTEYVDFLRVGIKNSGTNGTSTIDIEGLFTNLER